MHRYGGGRHFVRTLLSAKNGAAGASGASAAAR